MTAPAVIAGDKPKPCAIPINATPIVAAVVHELPILMATTAHMTHAAA